MGVEPRNPSAATPATEKPRTSNDVRQNLLGDAGKSGDAGKKSGIGHFFSLWKKLPQWLNAFRYRVNPEQRDDLLDYEPIHLHVTPGEIKSGADLRPPPSTNASTTSVTPHELTSENFRFLLEQVPAIRTIEFSGDTDPFHNPYLIQLVDTAYKYNNAESTIYTNGLLLKPHIDALLHSRLHTLVVQIHANKPSQFSRLTELPPDRFPLIYNNLLTLLQRKRELNASVDIELCMTVDLHNFREIPDMIQFALDLGVNGVRFENYLSPTTRQKSDRTLFTHQQPVVKFMTWLETTLLPILKIPVSLPTLLDENMSDYRNCLEPFTTVSVDADFNISGCSRRLLYRGPGGKVWDPDFWNNELYQWLRSIHTKYGQSNETVPMACQSCPRNIPDASRNHPV